MNRLTIVLAVSLIGCGSTHVPIKVPITGQPRTLEAQGEVVWVTQPVTIYPKGPDGRRVAVDAWGIFACYRSATPAAPECFLARYDWRPDDLVWPSGALQVDYNGIVLDAPQRKPKPQAPASSAPPSEAPPPYRTGP